MFFLKAKEEMYNFGRKAIHYDFKALKFKSITMLYLKHMLISSYNAMAQGAIKQRYIIIIENYGLKKHIANPYSSVLI